MAKSEDVWSRKLATKSSGTQRTYTAMLDSFLERWGYTHESLFTEYNKIQIDRLTGRGDPRDADKIETLLVTQMNEMIDKGFSGSYARTLKNAVTFFFKSQGLTLKVDKEDVPSKDSRSRDTPTKEDLQRMLNMCGGMNELRNRALIMFLKDSGLRVSDVEPLDVKDYHAALDSAAGCPGFAWFKDLKTKKKKIWAYPVIGPDATEALDAYLEDRRAEADDPLFMGMSFDSSNPDRNTWTVVGESRLTATSMVTTMRTLGSKVKGKRMSAHSLRGYHATQLRGARVPMEWIKRLQGKKLPSSDDPYYHPEQNGDLLLSYVKAYPSLIYQTESRTVASLKEKIKELESGRDAEVNNLQRQIDTMTPAFKKIERMEKEIQELRKKREEPT